MSTEELAEQFVSLSAGGPGGCYGVRLAASGAAPVLIGRTPNPAVAREWVEAVRRFVAAAIRDAVGESDEVSDEFLTGPAEASTDENEGRLVGLPG